ncbi:hypothetical protein INT43_008264 [Umbelopsis isabellina]|uniref:Uncharacterized protein n=1 Tax=Mortierella isabellina TaxID=91625 RepID=A0A8H7PCS9_MORIS|nr:hypothetical protein INT43_008264 [Umbelopsis isabellina]
MASIKLAKNSLDTLLKARPSSKDTKSNNTADAPSSLKRKQRMALPPTKTGLKKIKHEMRYGHQKNVRSKAKLAESRQNPVGRVHKDEQKAQEKLERNVRYMTSVLKASDTERKLRQQVK